MKNVLQIVVTFYTTADAIAFESTCKNNDIKGKLISVPRELSAGCGIAWKSPLEQKQCIEQLINNDDICVEDINELLLPYNF